MTVYLLHFDRPLHHARHYLGYASDLQKRLDIHRRGGSDDARLMQVLRERGIGFKLARTWPGGDRRLERKLKKRHESPRLCPLCRSRSQEDTHGKM